jgi:GT2 family glycosyltransferase
MRCAVIILNWNGWRDTLECLESVFRMSCDNFRVLVCDNNSADASLDKIQDWAKGLLTAPSGSSELAYLTEPPIPKPVACQSLDRSAAEAGRADSDSRLILIQNQANLGFAAGMNVGLRCALADPDCQYFWLLNNDTAVMPDSLQAMVRRMEQDPSMGLCGTLTLSYRSPGEVQTEGGNHYSRWTARVRKRPFRRAEDILAPPSSIDYVNGASMLASRAFLEEVGLLEESYFLYFEELDWAMRARGRFTLGCAHDAIIYHKEGASIGSNKDRMSRSLLSELYLSRSRVLFTRRFFPWALPTVLAAIAAAALERACRGDLGRCRSIFRGMSTALASQFGKAAGR